MKGPKYLSWRFKNYGFKRNMYFEDNEVEQEVEQQ